MVTSNEGVQELEIKCAEKEDSGKYTCKVVEFGKEGEDETTCDVNIGGMLLPHHNSLKYRVRNSPWTTQRHLET